METPGQRFQVDFQYPLLPSVGCARLATTATRSWACGSESVFRGRLGCWNLVQRGQETVATAAFRHLLHAGPAGSCSARAAATIRSTETCCRAANSAIWRYTVSGTVTLRVMAPPLLSQGIPAARSLERRIDRRPQNLWY